MGSYTFQQIKDMVYKLLDEYQEYDAAIDPLVRDKVPELINLYYLEIARKERLTTSVAISQYPIANMLGETFQCDTHTITDLEYAAASAHAFYFEANGAYTLDVQAGSSLSTLTTLSTITTTSTTQFTEYKAIVTGAVSSDYLQLKFAGSEEYQVRNVALYPYVFRNSTAYVPAFTFYCAYSLPSAYEDLTQLRYRHENGYGDFTDFRVENNKLYIPRGYSAEFLLDYTIIPSVVTATSDTFLIQDRNLLKIPLAVCGDILMSNGFNTAAGAALKEQYETHYAKIESYKGKGKHSIVNVKGW